MNAADFEIFNHQWPEQKLITGMPEEEYHPTIALAAGKIKDLLRSPAHFKSSLENPGTVTTPAQRLGSIVHKAVLEGKEFRDRYVVQPDFGDLRTKQAKEAKSNWLNDVSPLAIIINEEEAQMIQGIIYSVMKHKVASKLIEGSVGTEVSGFFNYQGLRCKIRPDLIHNSGAIVDLKTTMDCSPREFERSAWTYKYHVQAAWYLRGMNIITGNNNDVFAFIAVEKEPPYACQVYTADEGFISLGDQLIELAIKRLKKALETKEWSAYSDIAVGLTAPPWGIREVEEMIANV